MLHLQCTGASWQIACCIERFACCSKLTARVGYSEVSVFAVSAGRAAGRYETILNELTGDSRLVYNDIVLNVNLSRIAVRCGLEFSGWSRVDTYTILRGDPICSDTSISALIFVYHQGRMRGTDVVRKIIAMREVVSCRIMCEDLDVVLQVEASTSERLHKARNDISVMSGVINTVTSFVLSAME
jgi:Lrp/AsnC family leucine-responsive transcriptional regulator